MESARAVKDLVDKTPIDLTIEAAGKTFEIKSTPVEELVLDVVRLRQSKKGVQYLLKQAEKALIERLRATGQSSVSVPGFEAVYDYPDKRLWDVEELMAMTGEEDTSILLRVLFSKITPAQVKALKDSVEDEDKTIKEIIENAERLVPADKKKLTITETGLVLTEASG